MTVAEAMAAGLVAGYAIAIPVGAIGLLLVTRSARLGTRASIPAALGVATADLVYAALAVIVGGSLAARLGEWATTGRRISGVVVIVVGLAVAGRSLSSGDARDAPPLKGSYLGYLGLTVINPQTLVYFAAVAVGLGAGSSLAGAAGAAFATAAFVASASWQVALVAIGGVGHRRLGPAFRRWAALAGAVVVTGLGIRLLV